MFENSLESPHPLFVKNLLAKEENCIQIDKNQQLAVPEHSLLGLPPCGTTYLRRSGKLPCFCHSAEYEKQNVLEGMIIKGVELHMMEKIQEVFL